MRLQTGTFVKVDEVKNGDIVTILDAGEVRENDKFTVKLKDGREVPKKDYVFKISINGIEKVITMNKISRDNLSAAYTNETENWVGKKASIEKCLFANGKRGIVLSPITEVKEGTFETEHEEEPPIDEGQAF